MSLRAKHGSISEPLQISILRLEKVVLSKAGKYLICSKLHAVINIILAVVYIL